MDLEDKDLNYIADLEAEQILLARADKEKKSSMEQMTPLEWATRTPALRGKEAQRDATIAALS